MVLLAVLNLIKVICHRIFSLQKLNVRNIDMLIFKLQMKIIFHVNVDLSRLKGKLYVIQF